MLTASWNAGEMREGEKLPLIRYILFENSSSKEPHVHLLTYPVF